VAKTRLNYEINPDGTVNVMTPDGEAGSVPEAEARKLFAAHQARPLEQQERYDLLAQQAKEERDPGALGAFLGEAARTGSLGLLDVALAPSAYEREQFPALTKAKEEARLQSIVEQRQKHPIASGAGAVAGALATAAIPGGPVAGAGRLSSALGAAAIRKLGVAGGRQLGKFTAREIAAGAVTRGAAEAGILGAGTGISEAALTPGEVSAGQAAKIIATRAGQAAAFGASLSAVGVGLTSGFARVMRKFRGPSGQYLRATQNYAAAYARDRELLARAVLKDPKLGQAQGAVVAAHNSLKAASSALPGAGAVDDIVKALRQAPKPPTQYAPGVFARPTPSPVEMLHPALRQSADAFIKAEAAFNARLARQGFGALAEETKLAMSTLPLSATAVKGAVDAARVGVFNVSARELKIALGMAGAAVAVQYGPEEGGRWLMYPLGFFLGYRYGPMALGSLASRLAGGPSQRLVNTFGKIGKTVRIGVPVLSVRQLDEIRHVADSTDPQDVFKSAFQAYQAEGFERETAMAIAEHEAGRLKAIKDAVGSSNESFQRTLEAAINPLTIIERIDKKESVSEDVAALESISPAAHNRISLTSQRLLDDPEVKWAMEPELRANLELWSQDPSHDTALAAVQNMYRAKLEAAEGQDRSIRGRQMHRPSAATSLQASELGGGVGLRG
jgi:hypothetical protein